MATQLDREGIFRAIPTEFGIRPPKDGAKTVMLGVKFLIQELLEGAEWVDWREYEVETYGDFCIVKKDGSLNEKTIEFLRDGLGWDGQSMELDKLQPCQIVVKPDEYNGKTRFRPQWMNAWDYSPQGMAKATPEDQKGFFSQYGAQLRAICGAKQSPAPKPAGKPASPPPRIAAASSAPKASAPAPTPPKRTAPKASSNGAATATATLLARTRDEAWAYALDAKKERSTEAEIQTAFYKAIDEVSAGRSEDELTEADWSSIAENAALPF